MIFVKLIDTDDTTDLVVAGDADQRNELAFMFGSFLAFDEGTSVRWSLCFHI